ncbi:hypothetical protein ACN469_31605 [Corallococcus terminator]
MEQPSSQSTSGSPPVNKYSSTQVLLFIAGTLFVGIGLGVVSVGLKKGGFLTTTDVGGLAELASIQEQLRPLEACEITYNTRDKRGHRKHPDTVFTRTCTAGDFMSVTIRVPSTWSNVGFEMTRGSMSEPWEVLVEKDEVPFPELKAALYHFAPLIAAQYPDGLRERRERSNAYEHERRERERAEEERKKGAKNTYPE